MSYADFITLLFAFFVVMYAISSVNEGKYRVLSDSIVNAFRNVAVNESGVMQTQFSIGTPVQINPRRASRAEDARRERRERARLLAAQAMSTLDPLVRAGLVRVSEGARGITIEINASVLFAPGEASLEGEAQRVLRAVAGVLAQGDFPLTVEGHADDTPIASPRFPSNWELSSVRAASVVRLLTESGVPADRLTASGFGDQRPLESNATPEGRARNRRVAILIESLAPEARAEPSIAPGLVQAAQR